MLPRLEKCVCGCSLHTGSLILAWMYTIGSVIGLIVGAFAGPMMISELEKQMSERTPEEIEHAVFIAKMAYGIILALCAFGIFINGSLLVGVYKRNYCLMMPYLILAGASLCLNIFSCFILLFGAFISIEGFTQLLVNVIFTGVTAYFWLIIYSHFKNLKDEALVNQNAFNKL